MSLSSWCAVASSLHWFKVSFSSLPLRFRVSCLCSRDYGAIIESYVCALWLGMSVNPVWLKYTRWTLEEQWTDATEDVHDFVPGDPNLRSSILHPNSDLKQKSNSVPINIPMAHVYDRVVFQNTIGIQRFWVQGSPNSGSTLAGCTAFFIVACVYVCLFQNFLPILSLWVRWGNDFPSACSYDPCISVSVASWPLRSPSIW